MTNKLIDEIRNNLDNGNVTSEMLFDEATSKAKNIKMNITRLLQLWIKRKK